MDQCFELFLARNEEVNDKQLAEMTISSKKQGGSAAQSLIKKILNQPLSGKEKDALAGLTIWSNIAPIVNAASNFGKYSADSRSLSRDQLAERIEMAVGNLKLEAYEHSTMPISNSAGRHVDELVQGVIDRMLDNSVPGELFTMGSKPEEAGLL